MIHKIANLIMMIANMYNNNFEKRKEKKDADYLRISRIENQILLNK